MSSRLIATLALTAGLGLVATGCAGSDGSASKPTPSASSTSAAISTGGGEGAMNMDMGSKDEPSDPASMICGLEIQDAVKRTFAMKQPPSSSKDWSKSDRLFSCTYQVPRGHLDMSVQDALDKSDGRAYFDRLRSRLAGAKAVSGMENFGFPAFQTASGNVVFLKDGKTLRVDATSLAADALPKGYSRSEAAYSVAAAVIACWSE